jgi:hypothetical protein
VLKECRFGPVSSTPVDQPTGGKGGDHHQYGDSVDQLPGSGFSLDRVRGQRRRRPPRRAIGDGVVDQVEGGLFFLLGLR